MSTELWDWIGRILQRLGHLEALVNQQAERIAVLEQESDES